MEKYIGLDVHAASTTFAVIGESGKRLGSYVVETNGQALVEQIKTIPGNKHVCLEEGTQSAWIYEILSPHATEVVVTMVPESRGQRDDQRDAFALAERLRTGAIERKVFKEAGEYKALRELGRTHAMVVQDVVRVQIRRQAEKDLVAEAHRHPLSRVLETCPGLGPIRVAQLISIVVSPGRFRTKRQFWSYCGLGLVMRSSSDWVRKPDGGWARADVQKTCGLNLNHNHTLKWIFKGAATAVISQHEGDPLHQDYQRLISAGTKPNLAKLTIARKLAAIALSMWKSKEKYDPTKHRKQGP